MQECCPPGRHDDDGIFPGMDWETEVTQAFATPSSVHATPGVARGAEAEPARPPEACRDSDFSSACDSLAAQMAWDERHSSADGSCMVMSARESGSLSVRAKRSSSFRKSSSLHFVSRLWSQEILNTDVSADLLRGVSIEKVLAGFGKVFSSNAGTHIEYMKSVPVTRLNDFISHDWDSGRAHKLAALCVVYNGRAACIITFCASLVFVVLQADFAFGVLPYPQPATIDHTKGAWGCWSGLLCPLVFACVLLLWQNVRARLRMETKRVFLDKFCVDQVHPERKAKGILGLAGFLNKTDRLVICWTPRYFTRLWCVYEIAAWLHLRKPLKSVCFMPLALARLIVMQLTVHSLMCVGYALGRWLGSVSYAVTAVVIVVGLPLFSNVMRHLIHDLRMLPEQLENFSLVTANCFCCSVDHKMPGTGEELPCDRQVLCRTIKRWFASSMPDGAELSPISHRSTWAESSLNTAECIPEFDQQIRDLFGKFILKRTGTMQIRYRHCLVIVQPHLWLMLDIIVSFGTWEVPAHMKVCQVLLSLAQSFCMIPITYKVAFWWYAGVNRMFGILRNPILDWILSIVSFLPIGLLYMAMYATVVAALEKRFFFYFYGISVALVVVTLLMFSDVTRRFFGLQGRVKGFEEDGEGEREAKSMASVPVNDSDAPADDDNGACTNVACAHTCLQIKCPESMPPDIASAADANGDDGSCISVACEHDCAGTKHAKDITLSL